MSTRSFRTSPTDHTTIYPRKFGRNGAVAAEHYLAADAGAEMLRAGGNAIDAMAAAVLVEGVVDPQMHTLGGECPIILQRAGEPRAIVVNGNTMAPRRATPEAFRRRGLANVPDTGVLAAGVPAALGAVATALQRFGTMPFAEVAAPALRLARGGFPAHAGLIRQDRFGLVALAETFRTQWRGSAKLYLPRGRVPREGDTIKNAPLAAVFEHLARAERRSRKPRSGRIGAVLDAFYRGDIAAEIARYSRRHDGLIETADLAAFTTKLEAPAALRFGDVKVLKCGAWNQGPALLQALSILKGTNLAALGHNSADYLHLVIEAIKLAFADREQYYGDPEHVAVPISRLLSDGYGKLRRALIDPRRALAEICPGDPRRNRAILPVEARLGVRAWGPGTVHVDAIDRHGNCVAATPSGGWLRNNEVIPALGFPLTCRMMTFYLGPPQHPNVVAPGKRPRTTISPTMVQRRGQPWLVCGSMGGDQQDQWQLQFLLNRIVFDMPLQAAIEAPKLSSEHFPGFFAPHDFFPNRVRIEPRIAPDIRTELARRGHEIDLAPDWTEGFLLAAERHPGGLLEAGADPRGAKSEVFPATALCW
jgi:gamma-glutamyltranspeptidase/glutathione hydrolase